MADGGRDFGYEDKSLGYKIDNDGEYDDDYDQEEVNTTRRFQPGAAFDPSVASTPVEQYEMRKMMREQSGLPDTSYEETPLLGNFLHSEDKQSWLEQAKTFIKGWFPNVDFRKLGPIGFSKKGTQTDIVSFGSKGARPKFLKKMEAGFSKALQTNFQALWGLLLNKSSLKTAIQSNLDYPDLSGPW